MASSLMNTRLGIVGPLILASSLVACAMGAWHSTFVDGALLAYVTKGDSGPTVVFEAGLDTDGMKTWKPIFEAVSAFSAAMAYSRAGYTGNAPAFDKGGQRTADDVARSLEALIDKADLTAPYILVGHSIGGMYALRFARLFPAKVAGVVLVDGRPKGLTRACTEAGISLCGPPEVLAAVMPAHMAAEIRGRDESDEQMPDPHELGDLPVTVIVATEPPVTAPAGIQPIWLDVQQRFANSLENGRYVVARGSGHYVHRDAAELVVREIRQMVEGVAGLEPSGGAR